MWETEIILERETDFVGLTITVYRGKCLGRLIVPDPSGLGPQV